MKIVALSQHISSTLLMQSCLHSNDGFLRDFAKASMATKVIEILSKAAFTSLKLFSAQKDSRPASVFGKKATPKRSSASKTRSGCGCWPTAARNPQSPSLHLYARYKACSPRQVPLGSVRDCLGHRSKQYCNCCSCATEAFSYARALAV